MAGAARRPQVVAQSAAVVVTYFIVLTAIYRAFLLINTSAHPPYLTLMTAVTTASLLSNIPVSVNGLGTARTTARHPAAAARRPAGGRGGHLAAHLRPPARVQPLRAVVLATGQDPYPKS
jgi:hypothetical protein